MTQATAPLRFVSVAEFRERSSLSISTIYKLMADGALNRPSKISTGRVAWPVDYIDAWLASRMQPQQVAA